MATQRVVIVGGGFGGLHATRALRRRWRGRVDLVDRRNFHLFQPLLYQVATGGLSAASIAAPLRTVLARQKNAHVHLANVTGFEPAARRLLLADGDLEYDTLVVAAGARNHHFGHDDWETVAPGLKTLEDAARIRERILRAFERAERAPDAAAEWLTFAVVGGGPTGVELAGALGEIARYTLRREFRSIDPAAARILLVEGAPRILPGFHEELSAAAERRLAALGVEVRTSTLVERIDDRSIAFDSGETLACRTVVWAAGVRASPLGRVLADATGAELDEAGRVRVAPDLSLPGHPEIFVIGDLARCDDAAGRPLPGVAPVAIQQGEHVARIVRGRRRAPFSYRDRGSLATIGRKAAVAELGRWRLSGFVAWLVWLFVHLVQLVQFEKRVLVLVQWAWNYFTFSRNARIIVHPPPAADDDC